MTFLAATFGTTTATRIDGWNISTATYSKSKDVSGAATNMGSVAFKPDGTKMFVLSFGTETIYQYGLSTPWEVDSAGDVETSFSTAEQTTDAFCLRFKPDGSGFYVLDVVSTEMIYQYDMTDWDLTNATYSGKSLGVSGQDSSVRSFDLNSDGTKLYLSGTNNDVVYEYAMTAYDISTAVYNNSSLAISGEGQPYDIFIGDSDRKLYLAGNVNDKIFQYDISSGLSAGSLTTEKLVSSQESTPYGVFLGNNGTRAYVIGGNNTVYQYNL